MLSASLAIIRHLGGVEQEEQRFLVRVCLCGRTFRGEKAPGPASDINDRKYSFGSQVLDSGARRSAPFWPRWPPPAQPSRPPAEPSTPPAETQRDRLAQRSIRPHSETFAATNTAFSPESLLAWTASRQPRSASLRSESEREAR